MTLANLVGKGLEKAETDAAEIARYLEKIRRKLADFEPSEKEVKAVIEAVERLRASLVAWIRKNHPALLKTP
jgi:hypothetical protein